MAQGTLLNKVEHMAYMGKESKNSGVCVCVCVCVCITDLLCYKTETNTTL